MPYEESVRPAARLAAGLSVGFLVLILSLFQKQVVRGDYYRDLSEKNRLRVAYVEAPRGRILDRRGEPLAKSRPSFNCSALRAEAEPKIRESCRRLGAILSRDPADLERNFYEGRSSAGPAVLLAEGLSAGEAAAVEEQMDRLPGIVIETKPEREYPLGAAAAHVTGFTGPMTEEEEETYQAYGYHRADWVGLDGIEKSFENHLRGRSGGLQMEVDNRGRMVRLLGMKAPQPGKDLRLTLDGKLQSYAQELLGSQRGAVIVMELERGGILSMNSSPSFDTNLFASPRGRKSVGKYLNAAGAPMLNRGLQGQYPPGSVFKVITAFSALEAGKLGASTFYDCAEILYLGGAAFRCWKEGGHGPQDLIQAMTHSCNVFFYRAGLSAGADGIIEKARTFGLGRPTGIDLPGERAGFVPSKEWKRRVFQEGWYDGETANLSIGQGALQVTPLQVLVMIAQVARRGAPLSPHLAEQAPDKPVGPSTRTEPLRITPEHWEAVRRGLEEAVNSDTGTGRLSRLEGVRIAGKTGTAQSGQQRTHAWFAGYAPAENPKIAMVVFLEQGGRGGVSAASLARSLWEWLKEAHYL